MTVCEWCGEEADDWGYNGVQLCPECRDKQLEEIDEQEQKELERLNQNE